MHVVHASARAGDVLGQAFLPAAADHPLERHLAILHRHIDVGGVDAVVVGEQLVDGVADALVVRAPVLRTASAEARTVRVAGVVVMASAAAPAGVAGVVVTEATAMGVAGIVTAEGVAAVRRPGELAAVALVVVAAISIMH